MQKMQGERPVEKPKVPATPAASAPAGFDEQPKACGLLKTEVALEACNSLARSYVVREIRQNRKDLKKVARIPFAGTAAVKLRYGVFIGEAERTLDYLFIGITQEGKGYLLPDIVESMPEKILSKYAGQLRTGEDALSAMYEQYRGSSPELRRSFFAAMGELGDGCPTSDDFERSIREDLEAGFRYSGLCFMALVVEKMEKQGNNGVEYSKNFMSAAAKFIKHAAACAAKCKNFEEFDKTLEPAPELLAKG